jgi:hypothetical protein
MPTVYSTLIRRTTLLVLAIALVGAAALQAQPRSPKAVAMLHRVVSVDGPDNVSLVVGQLPDTLARQMPLPADSEILGSLVYPKRTKVYLSANQSVNEINSFYASELSGAGWLPIRQWDWGFEAAGEQKAAVFCQGEAGSWIELTATAWDPKTTDVRMTVHTAQGQSPCARREAAIVGAPPIPILLLPSGAEVINQVDTTPSMRMRPRREEAPGFYQSSILFRSTDEPGNLSAHFETILENAGWKIAGRQDTPEGAWSKWRLRRPDMQYEGHLIVSRIDDSNRRLALVALTERP